MGEYSAEQVARQRALLVELHLPTAHAALGRLLRTLAPRVEGARDLVRRERLAFTSPLQSAKAGRR